MNRWTSGALLQSEGARACAAWVTYVKHHLSAVTETHGARLQTAHPARHCRRRLCHSVRGWFYLAFALYSLIRYHSSLETPMHTDFTEGVKLLHKQPLTPCTHLKVCSSFIKCQRHPVPIWIQLAKDSLKWLQWIYLPVNQPDCSSDPQSRPPLVGVYLLIPEVAMGIQMKRTVTLN